MTGPSLEEGLAQVESARQEAMTLIEAGQLDEAKNKALGRKGSFKQLQKMLGVLANDARAAFGKAFNEARQQVQEALDAQRAQSGASKKKSGPTFDFLPGIPPVQGNRHPLTQTIEEITDIFARMGFELARGPEVEDPFHNFVALNIPDDHPARDPRDNFYITPTSLLRSQTSSVQIRVMTQEPPPIRMVSLGRVYRPDKPDPTHYPMFHQVEGLYVDTSATMADLKSVLRMFARVYLGEHVRVRFRPSFFPFTEPSIEVDMDMSDDPSNPHWVEMGGAGMVDPNVLNQVDQGRGVYNPEKISGFAFGLGIERLAMRRHGVEDIRDFFSNNVRFLQQFG